jgi:hypothetical protein
LANGADETIPIVKSAKSGPWSAAETWDQGRTPRAGDIVHVLAGHDVAYDVDSDQVIRSLHLDGTLTFAPDLNTRLDVGLIRVQAGGATDENGFDCSLHAAPPPDDAPDRAPGAARAALLVGTAARPIDAGRRALIRLTYIEGMDEENCPAIVCCAGRMEFHGAPLDRTWVKLAATAKGGDSEIVLSTPVAGWRPGDRVIVTATQRREDRLESPAAERTISQIAGDRLTLDRPFERDHLAEGEYRAEVANLSRNVIVESADPAGVRGHTMYHRGSIGSIGYAEFRHLGKPGVLGKYSLHFHLAGDTMRGASVIGASIWDSANRWLTIHGTNYLVVRDCVGYGSLGHGFFLEDGTEVWNVLDRNLAVGARATKKLPRQVLPFDDNQGAGFWWANSRNSFTRNVAAGNEQYGFRYEATPTSVKDLTLPVRQPDGSSRDVDIRTLPFVRFDDNEVHHSLGLYGFNLGEGVEGVGPDAAHPFIVRNFKAWDVHYAFRPQAPSLLVENLHVQDAVYGVYHPNFDRHVYRNVYIGRTNSEPFNRGHDDFSTQHGVLTVDGLTFDDIRSGGMPLVQISDDNPSGQGATHFRGLTASNWNDNSRERAIVNLGGGPRPTPTTPTGVTVYLHDWYGPGRHAMVVSTRSPEYKQDPNRFRSEPPLTGDESRVAEVANVEFPTLLEPVDDLPPTSVITHVERRADGSLRVSGVTSDNGQVRQVVVNGVAATAADANFAQWQAELTTPLAPVSLAAHAEDAAGNVEPRPHVVTWSQE